MNRKEAIEALKKYVKDNIKFYGQSTSGFFGEGSYYHQLFNDIIKALEQPITLADLLGWEENVEYRRGGNYLKIEGNHLLHKGHSGKWVNMNLQTWELIDLRQATKIEPKLKAYHVTDEYSYKCLMEELEEQGYLFDYNSYGSKKPTELRYKLPYGTRDYIYIVGHKDISWNSDFNTSTPNIYNDENYDLIEYHKEPKLKAYHVKDEYSYKCLMKKLEEQGYIWFSNKKPTEGFHWDIYKSNTVVFCEEGKTITYSELSYYETDEKSRYDLIEYHKEEPKYYARLRLPESIRVPNFLKASDCSISCVRLELAGYCDLSKDDCMTIAEWNKLGINDTNADFEEVE